MSAKCWACYHYDREFQICTLDGSGWSGMHRDEDDPACSGYRDALEHALGIRPQTQVAAVSQEATRALGESVEQLGQYISQLGAIIGSMQRRMDEMERQQAAVTIRHEDVRRLQAMIRLRADQICGKYELKDRESPKIFRAAMKKDLMKRYGVRDLHDVPAAQLHGAESLVSGWTNIRMVMERRS